MSREAFYDLFYEYFIVLTFVVVASVLSPTRSDITYTFDHFHRRRCFHFAFCLHVHISISFLPFHWHFVPIEYKNSKTATLLQLMVAIKVICNKMSSGKRMESIFYSQRSVWERKWTDLLCTRPARMDKPIKNFRISTAVHTSIIIYSDDKQYCSGKCLLE